MKFFMTFIKIFMIILIATFFVVPIQNIVNNSIIRSLVLALTVTLIDFILKKEDDIYEK